MADQDELCGELVNGDPMRPCAMKAGHKTRRHFDRQQLDARRDWKRNARETEPGFREAEAGRMQEYRETHPEYVEKDKKEAARRVLEIRAERKSDPSARKRGLN